MSESRLSPPGDASSWVELSQERLRNLAVSEPADSPVHRILEEVDAIRAEGRRAYVYLDRDLIRIAVDAPH